MPKLLRIDVSPRGDWSISKNVADAVEAAWKQQYSGDVVKRDISKGLPIVDLPWIAGAYTSPDQRTAEHAEALKLSDEVIAEIKAADHILIASPFWNFTLPAALTSWIDQVIRINETFDGATHQGLLTGKKVLVVRASGNTYKPGTPYEAMNHFDGALRTALGFIGITNVNIYAADNTGAVMTGKMTLESYLADHKQQAVSALLS